MKLSAVVTAERAALAAARPRSRVSVSSRVPNPMATEDQLDQDFGLMAPAASPPLPEPIVRQPVLRVLLDCIPVVSFIVSDVISALIHW